MGARSCSRCRRDSRHGVSFAVGWMSYSVDMVGSGARSVEATGVPDIGGSTMVEGVQLVAKGFMRCICVGVAGLVSRQIDWTIGVLVPS